jgi:hypothetical protein
MIIVSQLTYARSVFPHLLQIAFLLDFPLGIRELIIRGGADRGIMLGFILCLGTELFQHFEMRLFISV